MFWTISYSMGKAFIELYKQQRTIEYRGVTTL